MAVEKIPNSSTGESKSGGGRGRGRGSGRGRGRGRGKGRGGRGRGGRGGRGRRGESLAKGTSEEGETSEESPFEGEKRGRSSLPRSSKRKRSAYFAESDDEDDNDHANSEEDTIDSDGDDGGDDNAADGVSPVDMKAPSVIDTVSLQSDSEEEEENEDNEDDGEDNEDQEEDETREKSNVPVFAGDSSREEKPRRRKSSRARKRRILNTYNPPAKSRKLNCGSRGRWESTKNIRDSYTAAIPTTSTQCDPPSFAGEFGSPKDFSSLWEELESDDSEEEEAQVDGESDQEERIAIRLSNEQSLSHPLSDESEREKKGKPRPKRSASASKKLPKDWFSESDFKSTKKKKRKGIRKSKLHSILFESISCKGISCGGKHLRVDKVLSARYTGDLREQVVVAENNVEQQEYLVKFMGFSYRNIRWLPRDTVQGMKGGGVRIRNFLTKNKNASAADTEFGFSDLFSSSFLRVDRVVDGRPLSGTPLVPTVGVPVESICTSAAVLNTDSQEKERREKRKEVEERDIQRREEIQNGDEGDVEMSEVGGVEKNETGEMEESGEESGEESKDEGDEEEEKSSNEVEDGEGGDVAMQVDEEMEYLVKWKGLPYSQCTWEPASVISLKQFRNFDRRRKLPTKRMVAQSARIPAITRNLKISFDAAMSPPVFRDPSLTLRDYQVEGFRWLVYCWANRTSCILADEMGLGKTIQSSAFLHYVYQQHAIRGPFLVIAPMSCLEQWRREIEKWTWLNCIIFHGTQKDRQLIQKYEWHFRHPEERQKVLPIIYKFHVLLTTYEVLLNEVPLLSSMKWENIIVDEGHRMKSTSSKLLSSLLKFQSRHRLVLTGTPLQNHIRELWSILHFLAPNKFDDLDSFLVKYEDLKTPEQVENLHRLLRPYMLRRMKEDVEQSIPLKLEKIVEVELTSIQKMYYRAVLEKNREFLAKGSRGKSNATPQLANIIMELRKCCNHPFLINGAEDRIRSEAIEKLPVEERPKGDAEKQSFEQKLLLTSSSKLILLDKLLRKLRGEGHRVLIFSQFVMVLDILQDFVAASGYPFERLDGTVSRDHRQSAIDRFSDKTEDAFIFFLSTRAGGLGLNLTSADTVVIYDSDWNPQNDLQAIARCHRIGQTDDVVVYRFITKGTYEQKMLDIASKKLALDTVVLGGADSSLSAGAKKGSTSLSRDELDNLLRFGAYHILNKEDKGAEDDTEIMVSPISITEFPISIFHFLFCFGISYYVS